MVRDREIESERKKGVCKSVSFGCNNYHLRISNDFTMFHVFLPLLLLVAGSAAVELIVTVERH